MAGPPEERVPEAYDPQQIEEGDPITLQDDLTNEPGELSLQYSTLYTRSQQADAKEVQETGPSLKLGVFKDVQVSVNPNYDFGRGSEHNVGNVVSDVLVHATDQTRLLPSFGFDLFYAAPFGAGHKSAEYIFRAIASRSLGEGDAAPRLHLNLTDYHLLQPDENGRKDQLQMVFGGTFLPTSKGALVADVIYGASDQGRGTQTFVEIGYTRELPLEWAVEVGIGKQVAGAANGFRVFLSIETDVHIF